MAATAPTLIEALDAAGYTRIVQGADIIWKISTPDQDSAIRAKIEILERKEHFHITKCVIQINHEKTLEQITARAKKRFVRVISTSGSIETDGRMRCIIELAPAKTDAATRRGSLTGGVGTTIGWTTTISHTDSLISVQLTDAFLIGDVIPDWWADIMASVTEAITPFTDALWDAKHLQELVIPVAGIPIHDPRNLAKLKRGIQGLRTIEMPVPLSATINQDRTVIESSPSSSAIKRETPMEILLARETAAKWQRLDTRIRQRKAKKASIANNDAGELDAFARIGAIPDLNAKALLARLEAELPNTQNASLLALTGASVIAGKLKRNKELVLLLSDTLRKISSAYGPLDSIKPLSHVVPEVLGDCWSTVNPEMAFKSWETSLAPNKSNPRIQHKIADLARKNNNYEIEFKALMMLAMNDRRREGLEIVAPRLIKLVYDHPYLQKSTDGNYLDALDRMIGIIPNNKLAILAIVHALTAQGDHRRALTTLDSCLNSTRVKLSNEDLAELNAAMGAIWHEKENNTALAGARYVVATTAPAEPSDDVLAAAEAFFSETNNQLQLRRVLKMRSERTNPAESASALERSVRSLVDHNLLKDALRDILRLLKSGRARQWYLDVIEGAASLDGINWLDVADTMMNANTTELPRDSIASWTLIAGRAALRGTLPGQPENLWLELLTSSIVIPLLSDTESSQIRSTLVNREEFEKLAIFTAARIGFAKKPEYAELVREIILREISRGDGLFEQAIAENSLNTNSIILSMDRASWLIGHRHFSALQQLKKAHLAFLAGSALLIEFLDHLITQIAQTTDVAFENFLDEILNDRIDQSEATQITLAEWTKLFLEKGFLRLSERLLRTQIEHGKLGVENENLVSSLFIDDPATMARWHCLARAKESARSTKRHHALEAVRLWLTTNDRPAEMIEIIGDLASDDIINPGLLELLETLCFREKAMDQFINAIDHQIILSKPGSRANLSHWGIRVIMSHARDPMRAASYYKKWHSDLQENNIHNEYALGQLYFAAEDVASAQRHLLTLLNLPEILAEPGLLANSITLLTKCRLDKTLLATTVQTLISWSRSAHNSDLTEKLVRLSITWHVANIDDLNREFIARFADEDLDRLADIACQILAKSERLTNGVQKTLSEWQETFKIASNREKWWSVIRTITSDRYLRQLRQPARCDLLHIHARNLFDNDEKRLEAIPFYEAIAHDNPLDSRVWIPLYSLYEESGATPKLVEHLDRIIPLLRRDGSILEKTPFNIESLTNSLRRARNNSKPGVPHIVADLTRPLSHKNTHDRASQMKQAWISSIPPMRITAMTPMDDTAAANYTEAVPADVHVSTWERDKNNFDTSAAPNLYLETHPMNIPLTPELPNPQEIHPPVQSESRMSAIPEVTPPNESIDWRDMVLNERESIGITERIMTMAFANETEKHVAVQCAALLNAETKALDAWHWPVWRESGTFDYSLSPSGRLFLDENLSLYGGPLHTLLRMITPIIIKSRQEKFLIAPKIQKLGIQKRNVFTNVSLDHAAINRGSLRYFKSLIDGAKATFCDTDGLGSDVFFDLQTRVIHFDGKWQMSLPPGVLAYRSLEHLTNFQKGHLGITELDAETDIIPALEEIKKTISSSGMSRLRIAFGMQQRDLNDLLKSLNREQLISLLTINGAPSASEIRRLQTEIRLKSISTILASSLDVIGVLEALTGKNLCDANLLTPKRVFEIHPLARSLLFAAAKLIF